VLELGTRTQIANGRLRPIRIVPEMVHRKARSGHERTRDRRDGQRRVAEGHQGLDLSAESLLIELERFLAVAMFFASPAAEAAERWR
jgi:hypothetical protein